MALNTIDNDITAIIINNLSDIDRRNIIQVCTNFRKVFNRIGLQNQMFINAKKYINVPRIYRTSVAIYATPEDDLSQYTNIQKIHIISEHEQPSIDLSSLKKVQHMCCIRVDLVNINKMKHLTTLSLYESTTESILQLPKLETLSFDRRIQLNTKYMKCLKSISITKISEVDLIHFDMLINLKRVKIQDIEKITNIKSISHIEVLELTFIEDNNYEFSECEFLSNIKHITICNVKIIDAYKIGNVETLELGNCNTTDMSMFDGVKSLSIINDSALSQVSRNLHMCESLSINGCDDIESLPYLSSIKKLDISATRIRKIKKYKHVNIIKAIYCEFLEEIPDNDNLQELYIDYSDIEILPVADNLIILSARKSSIIDIPYYINLRELNISSTTVEEIHAFPSLTSLDISYTRITTIPMLPQLIKLHAEYSDLKLTIIQPKLEYINLENTDTTDVNLIQHIKTAVLSKTRVTDVSMLGNLEELNIEYTLVEDVSALVNVKRIYMKGTLVSDVSMLQNAIVLDISRTLVADISMLTKVKHIYIDECDIKHHAKPNMIRR